MTAATRDRRLRRRVLLLDGCLGALPEQERRVLELRAGIGIGHPRSRRTVVRITGLGRKRVARLERTGLRRLDTLARTSGCAGTSQAAAGASGAAGLARAAGAAPAAAATALATGAPGKRTPHSAVRGEQNTHRTKSKNGRAGVALLPPAITRTGGADQTGVLFALLALAAGGYALWRRRRNQHVGD